jgi:hypothetical protein
MKKITLDIKKNMPYIAALVQAGLFAKAGSEYFGQFGWLIGFGVGAVVNYSIAMASSRVNDVAKKRKGMAVVSLAVMLVLSPATIAMSLFMPESVFTAVSWAVCVDLSIVLAGSITGKSFIAEQPTGKAQGKAGKPARKTKQVARKPITEQDLLAYLAGNPGESHQQVADHFGVTRQAIGGRIKKIYTVQEREQ